jgi:NADH:ubiquinone oxidoreductase subunit 5 (subunit L)/multisubunit Na+/H+ antiporter MnhA subunit
MSDVRPYLWLIPALPLAACAVTTFLGPRLLRRRSHWPCILAAAGACILAILVFLSVYHSVEAEGGDAGPKAVEVYYSWLKVGNAGAGRGVDAGLTLRADALSVMMVVMVTICQHPHRYLFSGVHGRRRGLRPLLRRDGAVYLHDEHAGAGR